MQSPQVSAASLNLLSPHTSSPRYLHQTYEETIAFISKDEKKGSFNLLPQADWPSIIKNALQGTFGELDPQALVGEENRRLSGIVEEKSDCAFQAAAATVFTLKLLDYADINKAIKEQIVFLPNLEGDENQYQQIAHCCEEAVPAASASKLLNAFQINSNPENQEVAKQFLATLLLENVVKSHIGLDHGDPNNAKNLQAQINDEALELTENFEKESPAIADLLGHASILARLVQDKSDGKPIDLEQLHKPIQDIMQATDGRIQPAGRLCTQGQFNPVDALKLQVIKSRGRTQYLFTHARPNTGAQAIQAFYNKSKLYFKAWEQLLYALYFVK